MPLGRQLDAAGNPNGVQTVEGRIYGDAPWGKPNKMPTRWGSIQIINDVINRYLQSNWDAVRSDLALSKEHVAKFDTQQLVGDGLWNEGSHDSPSVTGPHPVSCVTVVFNLTTGFPAKFFVLTSYPSLFGTGW